MHLQPKLYPVDFFPSFEINNQKYKWATLIELFMKCYFYLTMGYDDLLTKLDKEKQ